MFTAADYALALATFAGGATASWLISRKKTVRTSEDPNAALAESPTPSAPGTTGLGIVALAELLREVVLVLDKNDRLVFLNAAAKTLPGLDGEVLGKDAAVLIRSADFLECLRNFRAGRRTEHPVDVLIRRAPSAPDLTLEAVLAPLPESAKFGPDAVAAVLIDVSRLRRLENIRREFVANVSHDLRTPVTIVKGFAQTLAEDYDRMEDTDRKRFIEKIQRNTRRLHLMLEDLLELSTLEETGAAALHPAPGVLHQTLRETAEALEDRFKAAGIALETEFSADDRRVGVDAAKFSRVAQNLLENALRYAAGATRVRIITRTTDSAFEVRFEDDGPGVAYAEYEKVFERFYRAEKSRSVTGGGSGLGLSIVKHILLAHGGEVKAEPARGTKGFAAVLTLPLLPPDRA